MENNDLERAIALAQAGDYQHAQSILERVVQTDPRSEQGWLWLGHCLSEVQKRQFCYRKVLAINPQNESARQALQALNSNTPPAQQEVTPDRDPVQARSTSPAIAGQEKKSSRGFRSSLPVLVPILFVFLCVLPFLYLLINGQLSSFISRPVPSPSRLAASPSPSATQLPASTSTPSPTSSPTRAPDTPTPSLSSTSTRVGFQPGDPTATPLGSDITDPNFKAGVTAYDAGDYQEALRLMNAVIGSDPDLAPPYRYRGLAYWSLNECVPGLADEQRAVTLNPDYAAAWGDRGLMNRCLGDDAQGFEDYQKALSLDPSLAFVVHDLGVYYSDRGNYEKALEEYNLSAAIDPARADAWDGMSEAFKGMGQYQECIDKATQAIEMDPKYGLSYADRGICHLELDQNAEAIADFQVYLDNFYPTDFLIWYNLGIAQRHLGDVQAAITSYSKALKIDPYYSGALINRGNIYFDLKGYDSALSDYNAAIQSPEIQSADIPHAYFGRGMAYYGLKKYDLAIADFETVLSLEPSDAPTYCHLAIALYFVERYQEAVDAAQKSIELDPTCGEQGLLEIQGRSYYALGEYDQALLSMDKALAAGPYTLGYYYRGIIFQAAGRNAEAIQDLQQFLVLAKAAAYQGPEVADAQARLTKLKL